MALAGTAGLAFVKKKDQRKGASSKDRRDTHYPMLRAASDICENVRMEQDAMTVSGR